MATGAYEPPCVHLDNKYENCLVCVRDGERERGREEEMGVADFMADSAMECYKVAKISVQVALCEMRVHNVCVCACSVCVFMHALYLAFRFACIIYSVGT